MSEALVVDAEVLDVLRDQGIEPARIVPIGGFPRWRPGRVTYRVDATGGRVYKVRRFEGGPPPERAAALVAALDLPDLPPPLVAVGAVTLDSWVPGRGVDTVEWDDAVLDAAADLLGRLHGRREVPGHHFDPDRSTGPLREDTIDRLDRLVVAALLTDADAARFREVVERGLPDEAALGPIHGDLAPDNLVINDRGAMVSIDNERVRVDFLDYDLARTWVRWSMSDGQWAQFARRYAAWGREEPDSESRGAWRVVAMAKSATTVAATPGTGAAQARARIDRVRGGMSG